MVCIVHLLPLTPPHPNQLKLIFQGNKNKAKQAKHLNRWLIPVALNEK